jgi:AmmeMemoRadiSam system protein A
MHFSDEEHSTLLSIALASIKNGLECGKPAKLNCGEYSAQLRTRLASFVTLEHAGTLRGCIGTLEAQTSLVESIADNAYAAAFKDPRFPPLSPAELEDLVIRVSVLSPLMPVIAASEQELLAKMLPGEAGWVLQEGGKRGTFLPTVWSSLDNPADFLQQLRLKAGLSPQYWSDTLEIWRYTTTSFSALATEIARQGKNEASAG